MSIISKKSPLKVIDSHGLEQIYFKAINVRYFSEKMTTMSSFAWKLDIYIYIYLSILILPFFAFHVSLTLLVTVRFLLSVFCSAFKEEVLFTINSFSEMCLTNNRKYQANYVTKTKLLNYLTVIIVY